MNYREDQCKLWIENPEKCKGDVEKFLQKGILTEIQDGEKWKIRYMEKSNHNLDFATLISDIHATIVRERFPRKTFYDWVTVASYYSVYHSALALISNVGIKSTSHIATLCGVIAYYYHKEKQLEKKHIEVLGKLEKKDIDHFVEAQGLRERASYGVSTNFEESLSNIAKSDAIDFVNKVKEILKL